jgi:hypothetical protein
MDLILTDYDLTLIKSMAVNLLVTTKLSNRYEALAETLLGCIYAKGFKLSPYPKDLIKLISNDLTPPHVFGQPTVEASSKEVIALIFKYLKDNNIEISKDENKTPTWSGPRASWYTEYINPKKPWVF